MKLIFEYQYYNGVDSWTTFHTFDQFNSKEDLGIFLLELLNKPREFSNLLNVFISDHDEIEIERNIFTIEEWFESNKIKTV